MTNQTKPYYRAKSPAEYRKKYPDAKVLLDLDQKFLSLSASKWGREHLIACRVIQKAGSNKILPILKEFAPKPRDLGGHEEWLNIEPLIEGLSKDDLRHKSRLELERENGELGTLWSALAKCVVSKNAGDAGNAGNARNARNARRNPPRERRQTQKHGYVSNNHIRTSQSPLPESSSAIQRAKKSPSQESYKTGSSNHGEVDEDDHTDRTKPEILTVNLAGAFIRYVLNFCAVQNPAKKMLAEFREEPVRRVCHDLDHLKISATDDGGIWRVATEEQGKHPWTWSRRLALLEAKAFQRIGDNNRPEISDDQLAQYTCEALTACLDPNCGNEVFVVVIIQTFMCFLHFARTEEYIKYLSCNNLEEQKASNAFLYLTNTEFFALHTEEGRRHAVCNLLGLVKFWEREAEDI